MMKNYKIVLSYDGGRYNGWQKQGNTENTIQGKLEQVLSEIAGEAVEVNGSGRTDAGTHALGQVANFKMRWHKTAEELRIKIQKALSEDMALHTIEEMPPRFHSRLSATAKTYEYRIWMGNTPPVFWRRYVFWCEKPLDVDKMQAAAQAFIGTHDFMSFCANKRIKKSTARQITSITFAEEGKQLCISFTGNGFLYQMVRILVGTLIEVGEGKKAVGDMPQILEAKNREDAGFTAPSRGLFLKEVFYEERGKSNDD